MYGAARLSSPHILQQVEALTERGRFITKSLPLFTKAKFLTEVVVGCFNGQVRTHDASEACLGRRCALPNQ